MVYSRKSQEVSGGGDMAEGKHFAMAEEFAGPDFHSIRLEERFVRTMETFY
jgi:hypothetical protein